MRAMTQPDHLSTGEAAKELGVSERTIQNWIRRADGPFPGAFKLNPSLPNSPYRIPRQNINALKAKRERSLVPFSSAAAK